jgi:hypothetical protein
MHDQAITRYLACYQERMVRSSSEAIERGNAAARSLRFT